MSQQEPDHDNDGQPVQKTWCMQVAIGVKAKTLTLPAKQREYVYATPDQIKLLGGFTCLQGTVDDARAKTDVFNQTYNPNGDDNVFPHAEFEDV